MRKLKLQPRAVRTEREEIGDLKAQMNDIRTMLRLLQSGQVLETTTDTEQKVVDKFKDPEWNLLFQSRVYNQSHQS